MTDSTPMKPLRGRDMDYIQAYLEGSTITAAYRAHIATKQGGTSVAKAASQYHNQPHIQAELKRARRQLVEAYYLDVDALLLTQIKRLEGIHLAGMAIGPDGKPNSLPAAMGAVMGISKLLADSIHSGTTKLQMLRLWTAIQGELGINNELKVEIANSIMNGDAL